jgi:2-polyprenyl-3-methyl-5-hydroxy-6-metoxy-1,4-benzoquinol methylase
MSCPLERNRVLDFGGGNGVLAPTLSRLYRKVFCVDLRTEVGEELSRREKIKNISFLTGELASFKLPDNHFDTIIATDVLEHIPAHDELLKEFCRLLTPGGELLVCSPSENWFYELGRKMFGYTKPPDHYHTAAFIDKTLSQRFLLAKQRYFPLNIPALGVFSLARFVNNSTHP